MATACYLADDGFDVIVVEKNEQLGGRISHIERDDFTFDMVLGARVFGYLLEFA